MTPAERALRRLVELAGDLADQIRDQPRALPPAHTAAMATVAGQVVDLAQQAAANLHAAAGERR